MLRTKEIKFKWLGTAIPCPEESLKYKNYKFYTECELENIRYEIGFGVIVKVNSSFYMGVIHFFYEIFERVSTKSFVAVELFYKPNDISELLAKPIELDYNIEVIKKDKVDLVYLPILAIKSRFMLVYGFQDENPKDLIKEFSNQTKDDTIYVCRYIASLKDNLFYLTGAVYNEECENSIHESDTVLIKDEDEFLDTKVEKYSITHLENNSSIKIKLKRQLFSPKLVDCRITPVKEDKHISNILANNTTSPSELMKKLTISNKTLEEINSNTLTLNNTILDKNQLTAKSERKPVVIIEKMNLSSPERKETPKMLRKSVRIKKSVVKDTLIPTPLRSSNRLNSKKTYLEFYESPDSKKCTISKNIKECELTPKRKLRSSRTIEKKNTDTEENFSEEENLSTKEINSIRQKRSIKPSSDITPIKQSRIKNTPKSVCRKLMSPTLEERDTPIVFSDTPMSRARIGLSAYSKPSKMPCRENEYRNIYNFITGRLKDSCSGCMYISGVPGTGKTMTVCKVMSDLSEKKRSSDFVFLHLNALALTEPRQIYVEIIKKLFNKKLHWEESLKEITKFFKSKTKKRSHILLIDELDKLCNRKQDVVYNLLDLPFHSETPLIVITIANTMDLPERILSNKVNSRLGLVRLTFKPYQYKDLVQIVTERLAADAVFKNEALELVARKVAAVSGDARRALAMCARATEIAEEEDKELVTMGIVDRVITEMNSSSKVQAIQCCSKLERLILSSIANEVTRTGNEEVPFINMLHNLEKLCLLESYRLPSPEVCLKSCHNLGSFRLLITQHGRTDINMILMLNISSDDIHFALRN